MDTDTGTDTDIGATLGRHRVPEHLHEGLLLYVTQHVRPGGFLSAVLANDLRDACGRGDPESIAGLVQVVPWLYNEAPARCWGLTAAVDRWLAVRADR